MDQEQGGREAEFQDRVIRIYGELLPQANALHDELLRAGQFAGRGTGGAVPELNSRGIAIRNLGAVAGKMESDGRLIINSQLIDFPGDIRDTIAHELAHAVVESARGLLIRGARSRGNLIAVRRLRRRGDWAAHGPVWRSVAKGLGDSGDRCHRLPLKPTRKLRRFLYRLDDGSEQVLSSVRHNRLQRNPQAWYQRKSDGARITALHFVEEVSP